MKKFICAIIKDEQLYLEEWIRYHLDLGIDEIYIYEDFDSKPHNDIIAKFSPERVHFDKIENFLRNKTQVGTSRQTRMANQFATMCRDENLCDWVASIDIDEFITLEDGYTLDSVLEEYDDYAGLAMYWDNYNANGHVKRPEGSIIENYTEHIGCMHDWDVKTFVNVKKFKKYYHIHITNGVKDINGKEIGPSNDTMCSLNCVYKKIWIRHYFTKSWEDYVARMERGSLLWNHRTTDNFFKLNPRMKDKEKELSQTLVNNKKINGYVISKKYKIYPNRSNQEYYKKKNDMNLWVQDRLTLIQERYKNKKITDLINF